MKNESWKAVEANFVNAPMRIFFNDREIGHVTDIELNSDGVAPIKDLQAELPYGRAPKLGLIVIHLKVTKRPRRWRMRRRAAMLLLRGFLLKRQAV